MIDFSSIAVFILATTTHYQKQSYLDTRIIPIFRAWGFHFANLFFVFGTNYFDWEYLNRHCRLIKESPHGFRKLVAHTRQVPIESKADLYRCFFHSNFQYPDSNSSKIKEEVSSFKVLWTANCTGEYFGIGPVCRCQGFYVNKREVHINQFPFNNR